MSPHADVVIPRDGIEGNHAAKFFKRKVEIVPLVGPESVVHQIARVKNAKNVLPLKIIPNITAHAVQRFRRKTAHGLRIGHPDDGKRRRDRRRRGRRDRRRRGRCALHRRRNKRVLRGLFRKSGACAADSKTGKQKKEKQIADMFIHRVTAHFRQDLSKAYHGFPGKSNKAGGCGADGAGDSCNLTRLRVS